MGPTPTDRGKHGVKRSVLVEGDGGPLALVVAGATVHDTTLLAPTVEASVVERPQPTEVAPQHRCRDKGYDNPTGHVAAAPQGYVPPIRRIGEEQLDAPQQGRGRRRAGRCLVVGGVVQVEQWE